MPNLVVIDDERIVVEWVRTMISRSPGNYQVVGSAGNGIQGLAVIRQKKPDIVITDIRIPGMDGLSLIEQVRTEFPGTAFIVISGWQEFSYAQRALKLQVMDYIDKPLNQEKLFSALERASAFLTDASGLSSKKSRQISSRIFEEFAALLENESPEAILAFAESALPRLSDSEQSLDSLKDHCGKIIYMTLEAVQERFPSALPAHTFQAYQEIRQLRSFEEVRLYTLEAIREACIPLTPKDLPPARNRDIQTLLDYIGSHYTQDIGLADLSSLVDMSPAAVSTFFKEQAGMSYVKYLTKIRIEHAMELLKQGAKAAEAGEQVGYNDYHYFSQVFKKLVHKTPTEYRDSFRSSV